MDTQGQRTAEVTRTGQDHMAYFSTRMDPALKRRIRTASVQADISIQDMTSEAFTAWLSTRGF